MSKKDTLSKKNKPHQEYKTVPCQGTLKRVRKVLYQEFTQNI